MSTWLGQAKGSLARRRAAQRVLQGDGVNYAFGSGQSRGSRNVNAKTTIIPPLHELDDLIEERYQGRTVIVKNTSGGTWATGTLLAPPLTGGLTTPSAFTATSSPQAGISVVITVAGTYEVGQLVTVSTASVLTGALPLEDKCYVSAQGGGTITVDFLANNHTLPTVTLDSAVKAVVADYSTGISAEWVTASSIADGAYGEAFGAVEISSIDTSALSAAGDVVYLTSSGAYSTTAPTPPIAGVLQVVGSVKVKNASGTIKFFPGLKRILKMPGSGAFAIPTSAIVNSLLVGPGGAGAYVETAISAITGIDGAAITTGTIDPARLGGITNTEIDAAAAIDGSKIDPDFTGQALIADTVSTGSVSCGGDVVIGTAGYGLQLQSGTSQRAGNATLVAGTITVTNITVTANTIIMLTRKTAGGTLGNLTYTLNPGATFTINSDDVADTSVVSYLLIELN